MYETPGSAVAGTINVRNILPFAVSQNSCTAVPAGKKFAPVIVACCPAVSVVGVMEICGTEPCAVAGVAVKNNAARDSSIAATIGILLLNLAPCFMTQFLSYVLYWRQTPKSHPLTRLFTSHLS